MIWYADRYLNILTDGLIVSEQPVIPADRFRHITWPEYKLVNLLNAGAPVNRLIWNEGLTGRVGSFTAAPYLRGGVSYPGAAREQTWGLKYGYACARFWSQPIHDNPVYKDVNWCFREPCWNRFTLPELRTKTSAYEMGFDDNTVTPHNDGSVTVNYERLFLASLRSRSEWWDINEVATITLHQPLSVSGDNAGLT